MNEIKTEFISKVKYDLKGLNESQFPFSESQYIS